MNQVNLEKTIRKPALLPLARLSAETAYEDIPLDVVHQAKLSLIDTLGCILQGSVFEEVQKVIQVEKFIGGNKEAMVFRVGERLPVMAATRVNAYMGDILEFNDITNGHPGIAIIPTSLAMAEYQMASGKELLTAIVLGYEVVGRIYNTFYATKKDYTESGAAPVGIPNTFGAAAVAGRLFHSNRETIFNTLNIAGALAALCSQETAHYGSSDKPFLFGGWPGSNGIYASICARAGLSGTPSILEGKTGLLRVLAHDFDLDMITRRIGSDWILARPRRKMHACCGYTHAPIEAAQKIVDDNQLNLDDIKNIEVSVSPYIVSIVGEKNPKTGMAARFSASYVIALGLTKKRNIMPQDTFEDAIKTNVNSPMVGLMKIIDLKPEPRFNHYASCSVKLVTRQGQEYRLLFNHPKGDPENPMTESEIINKFINAGSTVYNRQRLNQILDEVFNIDKRASIDPLINLLGS